jgi:hypothetical protein
MTKEEELLRTVLTHEFTRCTSSFNLFAYLMATLPKQDTKKRRVECYNAYVDFVSHLYEFYIGLIEREPKFNQTGPYKNYPPFNGFKKSDKHKKFDIILNEEVEKLIRNRKQRIKRGTVDNLAGNRIDYYDCKVPSLFGEHFRFIRNRTNHTDFKRASGQHDISLKDFFLNYHKFIIILYDECRWLWQVDENAFDWKDIDNFASEILK